MHFANSYWLPDYRTGIERLVDQLFVSLAQLHELRKFVFSYMSYFSQNSDFLNKLSQSSYAANSSFRKQRTERVSSRRVSGKIEPKAKSEDIDVNHIFREYVTQTASQLQHQLALALEIDKLVLAKLTSFIKHYEPKVRDACGKLEERFADFEHACASVEEKRQKYDAIVDVGEIRQDEPEPPKITVEGPGFEYPLVIGGVWRVASAEDLESAMESLQLIKTVKRTIPFPGYRNEIFSSDQLCDWFVKHRPYGFNPTRLNLEKLGQGLMDAKLIVTPGFNKRFRSENMWFEWSEQAVSLGRSTAEADSSFETAPKRQNDASRTINGMFKSLLKPKYLEDAVADCEDDYYNAYEDHLKVKHLLDVTLIDAAGLMEQFERLKTEAVFLSLTKLLEVVFNGSLESTTTLRAFAQKFIDEYNTPANHAADLKKTFDFYSTGVYFPTTYSPKSLVQPALISNNNLQNIKHRFNLFKDIPLQVQVGGDDPMTRSLPYFLHEIVTLLDTSPDGWVAPIDHKDYWTLKDEIFGLVSVFKLANENVDHEIIDLVVAKLRLCTPPQVVNFLKNWLLETSDTVIPCSVYDSLTHACKEGTQEMVRVLGTLPRSNLASLLFIMLHVGSIFEDPAQLNSMDAVGSVPFVHLILRPSVVKCSAGFKPPLAVYNRLLEHLLSADFREKLSSQLVEMEKRRQQKQAPTLGIRKGERERALSEPGVPTTPPKDPAKLGEFSLRPFRTGTTPRPSPAGSPVHRS